MLSFETPPHRRLRTPSAYLNLESSWTSSGKKSPIKTPTLVLVQAAAELQAARNPRPALPAPPQAGVSDVAAEHHFIAGPSCAPDLLLEDQQRNGKHQSSPGDLKPVSGQLLMSRQVRESSQTAAPIIRHWPEAPWRSTSAVSVVKNGQMKGRSRPSRLPT